MLAALRAACATAGVLVREHAPVARVELDGRGGRVSGVTLASGERLPAERVVLAAGPWSDGIGGLPAGARVPVRPVKGQILRLRDRAGPGLLGRVLRFDGGYLLPRGDGRYVLGATVEERGFQTQPTVGGVYELLRRAGELVPGVSELEIEELSVGFRPGTPDNLPAIGAGTVAGLTWATGHHRNGILLAPLTAELVAAVLACSVQGAPGAAELAAAAGGAGAAERSLGSLLAACVPGRFSPASAQRGHEAPAPPLAALP